MSKPHWTEKETLQLKHLWPKASRTELEKALPSRTLHSMQGKASRMGFKKDNTGRNEDGTFKRIRKPFSLDNFNDGYVDNRGRFRVWLPEHPRAYESGYVLRSIITYELYHGISVPKENDIHHKDENRLNDSKENLEMMTHGEHSAMSNRLPGAHIIRVCQHCQKEFTIERWRLKDPSRGKYCSQKCFHAHKRSKLHRKRISMGLKKAYKEGRR